MTESMPLSKVKIWKDGPVWRSEYTINGKRAATSYPGEFEDFCRHLNNSIMQFAAVMRLLAPDPEATPVKDSLKW